MKINGKIVNGPNEVITVVTRQNGDLIFKARAILDYAKFDTLCKLPSAPLISKPGEMAYPDLDDAEYKKAVRLYSERKVAFMIVESLSATEGIEFDTVKINDPTTWEGLETELKSAGLTDVEVQRIFSSVWEANGLDEGKIEEAKKRFLASQLAQGK
jgi:hypothetical protein